GDRERLFGYLEGGGKLILPEPDALLTETPKVPGLDGEKMSKSYGNTISLREAPEEVEQKIRTMKTDPARVRRNDPGDPANCPVWGLHELYSDASTKRWVVDGCKRAGIGCLDCKKPLIDSIRSEQSGMRDRARRYEEQPELVKAILNEGVEHARDVARDTLEEVRAVMGLTQR
ncbi:MAG: tryptophan--tRNA ligase, partial [Pseudomonadales bacterium]